MTTFRTRLIAVIAATGLILAACSSGGGGSKASLNDEEKPYAEALAASMKDDEEVGLPISDSQADCLAGHMVQTIGVDDLKAQGVEPSDLRDGDAPFEDTELTEAQANSLYDAFGKCDVDIRGIFLKEMQEDDEVDADTMKCLEEVIDEDTMREFMIAVLTNDFEGPAAEALSDAMFECILGDMDFDDMDFDDEDFDFDFDDEDFDFED